MCDDRELMARVKDGEQSALELLFARWEGRIFAFFYRLGGPPSQLADLTEEVLVSVYHQRHRYDAHRPFAPWLYGVARLVWKDYLRHRRREALRSIPLEIAHSRPAAEPNPSEVAAGREEVALVRQAIELLPGEQRTVFVLRHFEGLAYEEIAAALQLPLGTVKWRLHEAVRRLDSALAQSRARGVRE